MSQNLIDFLRARLDEDEQTARTATRSEPGEPERPWVFDPTTDTVGPRDSCGRDTCAWSVIGVRDTDDSGDKLPTASNGQHIARHDPARVLREVEAKRRIVAQYESATVALRNAEDAVRDLMGGAVNTYRHVLAELALPYDGHPDYREDWRP